MYFPDSEGRLGLDLMVIQKERQQQKFSFERQLKTAEAAPVRRVVRSNCTETSVVVLDKEEDVKSGSLAARGRTSSKETADFEADFKALVVALKEIVAYLENQWTKDVPEARELGLVGEDVQSEELRDFMQGTQKENGEWRAACAVEKAARAKILLEVSALWAEKVAQKKN